MPIVFFTNGVGNKCVAFVPANQEDTEAGFESLDPERLSSKFCLTTLSWAFYLTSTQIAAILKRHLQEVKRIKINIVGQGQTDCLVLLEKDMASFILDTMEAEHKRDQVWIVRWLRAVGIRI